MNFKKNEKTYDAEKSAVFKVLQEEASDPEPGTFGLSTTNHSHFYTFPLRILIIYLYYVYRKETHIVCQIHVLHSF